MNFFIGNEYNQICDSQGGHNKAILTDLPDGTTQVDWLPVVRKPGESWDNIYCWVSKKIVLPSLTAKLKMLVDVSVEDLSNLNQFEFETQAVQNQRLFNLAWQFSQVPQYKASTFDFAAKHWVPAFSLDKPVLHANKFSRFCALYGINIAGPCHTGIQYDGKFTPCNIQRNFVITNESNYVNFAFQFDSLNKGTWIKAIVGTRLIIE